MKDVMNETKKEIYEVDEKPEDRPRRRSKMPGKYSDFVMNSAKNRTIRVTSTSEVACSLARVRPLNRKIACNMMRHLAVMHDRDEATAHLDETDKRRLATFPTKATGAVRVTKRRAPKTPARVPHQTSSSSSSTERPVPLSQVPLPSARERLSSPQLEQLRQDLALTSDSDSDESYFVVISEDESPERSPKPVTGDAARQPTTSRATSPPVVPPTEGRKPVRPRLPAVRSIRSAIEAPQPLPKMPQQEARKRRTVLTTDRLAKAASENPTKSTQELADELAAEYFLTPEERRRCLHILRGMRVAQRHLCGRIRRAFPMTNGAEEHQEFLGWLQTTMREVEGRDSDELP